MNSLTRKLADLFKPKPDTPSSDSHDLDAFKASVTFYIGHNYFNRICRNYLMDSLIEDNPTKVAFIFDAVEQNDAFYQRFLPILLAIIHSEEGFQQLLPLLQANNSALDVLIDRLIKRGVVPFSLSRIVKSDRVGLIAATQSLHAEMGVEAAKISTTLLRLGTPTMLNQAQKFSLIHIESDALLCKNLWTVVMRITQSTEAQQAQAWDIFQLACQYQLMKYQPSIAFQGLSNELTANWPVHLLLQQRLTEHFQLAQYQLQTDVLCEFILNEFPFDNEVKKRIEKVLPGALNVPVSVEFHAPLRKIIDALYNAGMDGTATELHAMLLKDKEGSGRKRAVML